ncbi:MAG: arginase family protein [Actinobacteria bacterium]|nr:arginase family protein [Actinomycetota bacterium]
MSTLRARCPHCRTLTAVAIGPDYQCHACGREFGAGLVRVPRAWGECGERMAEAAWLELPYPEASVVDEGSLAEQTLAMASDLPGRPLVLGGCCCAHVGAVEGLSQEHGVLAVVWIDAHGDLNTPATSPSGNPWGMPLRMLIDNGAVAAEHVALVGARALDPPEVEFIEQSGVQTGTGAIERALEGADAVYVAVDCDSLEPGELDVFMPEPNGLQLAELEAVLRDIAARRRVAGAGLTGLVGARENEAKLTRLCVALDL